MPQLTIDTTDLSDVTLAITQLQAIAGVTNNVSTTITVEASDPDLFAAWAEGTPAKNAAPAIAVPPEEPTAESPTFTLADIQAKAKQIVRSGLKAEFTNLRKEWEIGTISDLVPEQYAGFMDAMNALETV